MADSKYPYASPPTRAERFEIQGGVMIAVERQYDLAERVQRAMRIRAMELGLTERSIQTLDEFFNAVIVRGLCGYNRVLVGEAIQFGITPDAPVSNPPDFYTTLADTIRQTAEDLRVISGVCPEHQAVRGAMMYLTQAAALLATAAVTTETETEPKKQTE